MAESDRDALTEQQVRDEDLDGWRLSRGRLVITYDTGSFARGAGLIAGIAPIADQHNHHPDVALTYPRVEITLWSHDVDALTDRDIRLARAITALARKLEIPHSG